MVGPGQDRLRRVGACAAGLMGLAAGLAATLLAPLPAGAGESDLRTRDTLTGDWGGARTRLWNRGIDLRLTYTGEVFGLLSGGATTGASYEDLIDLEVNADLEKLVGWKGGSAHVSLLQIDNGGRNAADLVGSLTDPSNIDASPTFRLFTVYLEQELGRAGSFRAGQIAADDEFLISSTAAPLIASTFGWPGIAAADFPRGGPAYPLATPGARLALTPTNETKIMAAVFSGDPAGECPLLQNPQSCNPHGTTFSFTGGAMFMGELQYRPNPSQEDETGTAYRIGGWYHTGKFADQAIGNGNDGTIIAIAENPASPIEHQTNWGLYAVVDQVLWQSDTARVMAFWRGGIAPPDRNFVSWYMDGGFGIAGLVPGRPDDVLTFGVAHSNVSRDEAARVRSAWRLFGYPTKVRSGNIVYELTYTAKLTPWWSLQPDLQYISYPGVAPIGPDGLPRPVGDALLVGLRTTVAF